MKQKHLILTILALFISGCNTNNNNQSSLLSDNITQESSEIMHRKTLDMVYNLHTDNNANAKGTIEITPLKNSNNLGYYIVYFAK